MIFRLCYDVYTLMELPQMSLGGSTVWNHVSISIDYLSSNLNEIRRRLKKRLDS